MARPEEKARATLNRFLKAKEEESGGGAARERRPYLASLCDDREDAEKWRRQVVRDVGGKVFDIQNPGLGEARIRDLNDEINKLLREKGHWERRIKELGGPDYGRGGGIVTDADGGAAAVTTVGSGGYYYFGAARDLPGVREVLERAREEAEEDARNRAEASADLYRRVDAEYYGLGNLGITAKDALEEEDRLLGAAESRDREELVSQWEESHPDDPMDQGQDLALLEEIRSAVEKNALPTELELKRLWLERQKTALLDKMEH